MSWHPAACLCRIQFICLLIICNHLQINGMSDLLFERFLIYVRKYSGPCAMRWGRPDTTSPYAQHRPMHNIALCTASPYAQHRPMHNIALCTASPYAQHRPMHNIALCTTSPYAQHRPMHNIALCTASPYARCSPPTTTLCTRRLRK